MPFEISHKQFQKLKQLENMLAQIRFDVDEVSRKLKCILADAKPILEDDDIQSTEDTEPAKYIGPSWSWQSHFNGLNQK